MKVNILTTIVVGYCLFEFVSSQIIDCPPGSQEYHAHPTECNKFIQCHDQIPVVLACPTNFFWNANELKCDWRYNVVCPGDEEETPPTRPIEPTAPTRPIENVTSEIEIVRYCDDYDGQNIAHPFNCSLYLACDDAGSVIRACDDGLYFNEPINQCDDPANVDCQWTTEEPTTVPTGPTDETTITPSPPDTTTTTPCPPETTTTTPCPPETTTTTPCPPETTTTTPCPPETTTTTPCPPETTTTTPCPPETTTTTPCPPETTTTTPCPPETTTTTPCPPETTTTTPCPPETTTTTPSPPETTTTTPCPPETTTTTPCPPETTTTTPCPPETTTTTPCPPETTSTTPCHPETTITTPCPPPETTPCPTTTTPCPCSCPTTTPCPCQTQTTTLSPPIIYPPSNSRCTGLCATGEDYLPHPTNCGKFIRCVHCVSYEMNCPSGLLWSKEKTVCDWSYNVKC